MITPLHSGLGDEARLSQKQTNNNDDNKNTHTHTETKTKETKTFIKPLTLPVLQFGFSLEKGKPSVEPPFLHKITNIVEFNQ